jgi:hypothetical protein
LIILPKIKFDFSHNKTHEIVLKLYSNQKQTLNPKINIASSKKRVTNPDVNRITPEIHKYDVDFLFDVHCKEFYELFSSINDTPLKLKIIRMDTYYVEVDFTLNHLNTTYIKPLIQTKKVNTLSTYLNSIFKIIKYLSIKTQSKFIF